MAKETYYFAHDYNAQNDPKIENMMFDKGWEGYGVYWALIERLAQEPTHKMQTHYVRIAFALRVHEDCVKHVIENYELFTIKDGVFWSNRLLSHFKEREEKAHKAKVAAGQRWAKEASKNANASETHMHTTMQNDAKKGKERKGKEKKSRVRGTLIFFGEASGIKISNAEYLKLSCLFGGHLVDKYIKEIEAWKFANGKNWIDDYFGILKWIRKDLKEGKLKLTWQNFREEDFESKADYDFIISKYL